MSLKSLIKCIGSFFERLFKNTEADFNNLPADQQYDVIAGVNVSEIIKTFFKQGEALVVKEVMARLNVSENVAKGVIDHVLKSWGIHQNTIEDGLNELGEIIDKGLTDDGWNGLWETVAKSAASWLSTGRLNWVTLGLGVIEFAYQKFVKGVK